MSDTPLVEPADTFYKSEAAEPIRPTDESVTPQEQAPEQEVEELEKLGDVEAKAKADPKESESEDESEDSQFIELDGEEVDLADVRKWKDGHLMQSDYTKKTTALSDERKTFDVERTTERENILKTKAQVSDMRDLLTVLVAEDEEINWVDLKEDDPDEYIRLKEQSDKRKDALAKVKAERETPADDPAMIQEQQKKLYEANPAWLDDKNQTTEVFKKDMTLLNAYAAKAGFTQEEFSQLTQAHHMTTILKAAKYDELEEKGREIGKTREKVPVVTRPKAKVKAVESKNIADVFYGDKAG